MKLKVPEMCDECAYIRPWYHGKFICGAVSFDDPQRDISTTYVDPAGKPDWCPVDKPNKNVNENVLDMIPKTIGENEK